MASPVSSITVQTATRLPAYLPAIYRDDPFLGQYLWAFERVLLDLETQIGNLANTFDPQTAREEFLPWLASWVAFTLRADLEPAQQKAFIAQIVPLYRSRGTKENLQKLLSIFTGGQPTITDTDAAEPAHHFTITLDRPHNPSETVLRQIAIAHALIDLERPAHTDYRLDPRFLTMQIGVTSHVGIDTLLGTIDLDAVRATPSPLRGTEESPVPSPRETEAVLLPKRRRRKP